MKRLMRLGLLTAVVAGALAAASGPAFAASPVSDLVRLGHDKSLSTNWSGYAAFDSTFSDVKGSWTVPTANCNSIKGRQVSIASAFSGLDGYFSSTVEQTGTDTDCIGNSSFYAGWYEFYPAGVHFLDQTSYPVSPGNVMDAEVAHAGSNVTVTLHNATQHWTFSTSSDASGLAFSSAEWIQEAPSNKLTDFGTINFHSATATDATHTHGAIGDFTHDAITLVSRNGRAKATPSDLSTGDPVFYVTFNHQ